MKTNIFQKLWTGIVTLMGGYDKYLKAAKINIVYIDNVLGIDIDGLKFSVTLRDKNQIDLVINKIVEIADLSKKVGFDKNSITISGPSIPDVALFLIKNNLLVKAK